MTKLKHQMGLEENLTYLNNASIGPLPRSSFDILQEYNQRHMLVGEKKIDYSEIEDLWDSLRENIARLVNGKTEGVAITTNTASGLHTVVDTLHNEFKKGQNIVLPDIEFITNSYVWQQVAKRYQLELRTISLSDYQNQTGIWEKNIDENTILVSLSHVQFSNGFRSNLGLISDLVHDQGGYICVDAIQSLGVVPFDIKKYKVDFVAAAGYKWLLAPLGTGLLYMSPELAEMSDSIMVGWFSTPNYKELSHNPFTPWNDARKFQQSMINPDYNSFNESLNTIHKWGVEKSYAKSLKLQDLLIKLIKDNDNFSISSSLDPEQRSGILKINCKPNPQKLVENLRSDNIIVSVREGGIRVSPHAYNDIWDIERLGNVLNQQ